MEESAPYRGDYDCEEEKCHTEAAKQRCHMFEGYTAKSARTPVWDGPGSSEYIPRSALRQATRHGTKLRMSYNHMKT